MDTTNEEFKSSVFNQLISEVIRRLEQVKLSINRLDNVAAYSNRYFKTQTSKRTDDKVSILEVYYQYNIPKGIRNLFVGHLVISENTLTLFLGEFFGDRLSKDYNLQKCLDDDERVIEKRVWDLDIENPEYDEVIECLQEIVSVVK